MSGTPEERGRVNQKRRTRTAIIAACQELITAGADINMPAVARAALVSEPTAYRYFPDLASLLEEALAGIEPDPAAALAAGARSRRSGRAGRLRRRASGEARHRASERDPRAHIRLDRPRHRAAGAAGLPLRPDRSGAGSALRAATPASMRQHSSSCGATSPSSSAPRPSSPSPTSTASTPKRRSRASCTPHDSSPKRQWAATRSASLVRLAVMRWARVDEWLCSASGSSADLASAVALDLEGSDLEMRTSVRDRWRARTDRVRGGHGVLREPTPPNREVFDPPAYGLRQTAGRLVNVWREQRRLSLVGLGYAFVYSALSLAIPLLIATRDRPFDRRLTAIRWRRCW